LQQHVFQQIHMTGVEILFTPFFDGGATVTALIGAGATALGYRQYHRDEEELFSAAELAHWRSALHDVRLSVDASHQAITAAWGSPLSLFREDDEALAALPQGASILASVKMAKTLVEEASQLDDFEDVYEAQFFVAEREGKGVLREPVLACWTVLQQGSQSTCPSLFERRKLWTIRLDRSICSNKVLPPKMPAPKPADR